MVEVGQLMCNGECEGRSEEMRAAHASLRIGKEEWEEAMRLLEESFEELGIDKREAEDAKTVFGSLRGAIVSREQWE